MFGCFHKNIPIDATVHCLRPSVNGAPASTLLPLFTPCPMLPVVCTHPYLPASFFCQVLARVANFVLKRIPECIDVEIEDPSQLEDADPQGRGQGAEM